MNNPQYGWMPPFVQPSPSASPTYIIYSNEPPKGFNSKGLRRGGGGGRFSGGPRRQQMVFDDPDQVIDYLGEEKKRWEKFGEKMKEQYKPAPDNKKKWPSWSGGLLALISIAPIIWLVSWLIVSQMMSSQVQMMKEILKVLPK